MRRFVLRENAKRYRRLLGQEQSAADRKTVQALLAATEVELAELERAASRQSISKQILSQTIAEGALDHVVRSQHAQFGVLHHKDASMQALIMVAQRNLPRSFLERFSLIFPGDGSSCGRCLLSGHGIYIEDVMVDPHFAPYRDLAVATGFRAMQSTPMRDGADNLRAVITTLFAEPRHFAAGERSMMNAEAERLAPSFDRILQEAGLSTS